jgi:hypothetical protein
MGLRYPNIGEEALEQFNRTGVYPSAMLDTLIVLWLCTLEKPEEVRRAMRRPDESIEKAITWGAAHGITDQKSEAFWKAYDAFISIVIEIENARAVPAETEAVPAEKRESNMSLDPLHRAGGASLKRDSLFHLEFFAVCPRSAVPNALDRGDSRNRVRSAWRRQGANDAGLTFIEM